MSTGSTQILVSSTLFNQGSHGSWEKWWVWGLGQGVHGMAWDTLQWGKRAGEAPRLSLAVGFAGDLASEEHSVEREAGRREWRSLVTTTLTRWSGSTTSVTSHVHGLGMHLISWDGHMAIFPETMRKTWNKPKLRDSLQNIWQAHPKIVKVIRNKGSLRRCHSLLREAYGDLMTKRTVASGWHPGIEKGRWGIWWDPNTVQSLVNSNVLRLVT